ncbi:hypothetical protein HAX54_014744 [Datura stramonium]|uniref:Uncharacterized protein n=1 Tax=Datura stramonium TaxID=4076 RepID=A0ABS8Y3Q7_DATST|nr:hypothetical protein [Datura stramonium]
MTRGGFQEALDPKLDLALMQTEMRVGRERGMERSDGRSLTGRGLGRRLLFCGGGDFCFPTIFVGEYEEEEAGVGVNGGFPAEEGEEKRVHRKMVVADDDYRGEAAVGVGRAWRQEEERGEEGSEGVPTAVGTVVEEKGR